MIEQGKILDEEFEEKLRLSEATADIAGVRLNIEDQQSGSTTSGEQTLVLLIQSDYSDSWLSNSCVNVSLQTLSDPFCLPRSSQSQEVCYRHFLR